MHVIIRSQDRVIDSKQLGGKAGTLATLGNQAQIPDWIVLTPSAFYQSLTETQRQQFEAGNINAVLPTLQLSKFIQAELTQALAQLCPAGEQVAVRSSALDEDGVMHSFAGQLESFLFVAPDQVADRVAEVWRSGFSAQLFAYRQEHLLTSLPTPPAVLIQKMVNPEVAGVAFSANPVTGQRGIAVVSAVLGLGTALVSGEADADTYYVDRQGQIAERHLTEKRSTQQFASRETENAIAAVQEALTHQPVLTDQQVQSIAALVRQIETRLGRPQDIEWAIAQGQLYLLQARPITTLTTMADPDGVLNLWDNSNIAESYGGVTTPLTFSFACSAYEAVYRQFCRMMGVSEVAIAQHDTTFRRMLGLIRGRVYYNLLSWYRVLALLPGFTVNRSFMEQMMGVREALPDSVVAEVKQASWGDKLRDSLRLTGTIAGLLQNYITLPRQIQKFYQRLDRALSLPASELASLRPDELAAYYHDLERQLLTRWDAPLVNDFFAMIFYGVLRQLTVKWCGESLATLQNDLISGEGGMISAEPAQRVKQMAAIATHYPALLESLRQDSLPEILQQITTVPVFQTEYLAYLEKFGDRCLEELKLESATLHDDPLPLLRSIGHLAQGFGDRDQGLEVTELSPRQRAEAKVRQALNRHPVRRVIFNWVLRNARARVRDRENLRFERTRLFGRVRRIFVELGQRLHALALLDSPRDIFYLEVDEILGFIDGTTTCTNLQGLVDLRQAEFERYRNLPAPGDRFQTHGIVHQGNSFQSQTASVSVEGNALQGMGCCPGIIRAPIQRITDPQTAVVQQGSILVAERTDPGWIMLFPAAAGLLVERGSLLSHAAIVAREMNLPAIVSLSGAMQWLKDGDWVEMDGSTGRVRRISAPAADFPISSLEVNSNGE